MTEIQERIKTYNDNLNTFKVQLTRWNQIKKLLKVFRNEGLPAPKRYLENAEEVLIQVVAYRMLLKTQRKKYDLEFLQNKMNKHVAAEEYEKAVPYRDRINYLTSNK